MKVILPDALHARPASLLVRLAKSQTCKVEVVKGERRADAKKILEVLGLRAMKGDEIEIACTGATAEDAAQALLALVERGFDPDLVPETGAAAVPGIAIGRALVLQETAPTRDVETPAAGRARLRLASARIDADLVALRQSLPPREAMLFEPEREILRDLEPRVHARVERGEPILEAICAETADAVHDLIHDVRARLLDALGGGAEAALSAALDGRRDEEIILVTPALTPGHVAVLTSNVVGIIAALEAAASDLDGTGAGFTSHAAILARGREITLAFMPPQMTSQIADGDPVILDTTTSPARMWIHPSEKLIAESRARRDTHARARAADEALGTAKLSHLSVKVRVNVGSTLEHVPSGAEGIGLVRTELVFAGRRYAPSQAEQAVIYAMIAKKAGAHPVTARLFDAGGDKPLAWLPPPETNKEVRGIELLLLYPEVLHAQLQALGRAASAGDVRALLPLVGSAEQVLEVRRQSPAGLRIGAMVETPDAVRRIDEIAQVADFICIGTNDLSALALSIEREGAELTMHPRVLRLVRETIEGAHARGREVTVCGEMAGDPAGAPVLVGLGVDAISVAPARLAPVKLALDALTLDDCRRLAEIALAHSSPRLT